MAGFVAGDPDGCRRGAAENIVGQADDIGFWIEVIRQISADTVNANTPDAVGGENPLRGLSSGDSTGGKLAGVPLEGTVDIAAGPQGQDQAG